jgi:ADP-ribose pyrophosphatase YjhB (NUDIX family)
MPGGVVAPINFCTACGARAVERRLDHRLRRVCTRCGKVLYLNPAPASGCIVEEHGSVLLACRKFEPWRGYWYIPSGFVEYDEDVEETARREVREETGLIVELGTLFGVYSYFDDPRQNGVIILYRASPLGGTLQAGDDASDVAFFRAGGLPPTEQIGFASHRRALREWRDEVLRDRPLQQPQVVTSAAVGPRASSA